MEIELKEIRDFIADKPPFDLLTQDSVSTIVHNLTIRYFRRGAVFPGKSNDLAIYIIRSGAIEIRGEENQLLDKLGEGDVYQQDMSIKVKAVCTEDTLVYVYPSEKYFQLEATSPEIKQFFNKSINERLKSALEITHGAGMRELSAMKLEVSGLTDRLPVIVDASTSIQEVAKTMCQEHVSSILVTENNILRGLLTDRDIRSRCVAENLDTALPVSTIMTTELQTVEHDELLSQALLLMTRHQIHHLPVIKQSLPVGILTSSDIVRHLSTSPTMIASDVYKANSVDALTKISQRLPELQLQLSLSSATAKHIGEVFSSITDAITCRLLELAEQYLGKAPVAYAWAAGGSQARNEQSSHSDQDNALILSDNFKDEHEEYFTRLADFVCDGLNACGYIYCPGNAMASNPEWRQPLKQWKKIFSKWIQSPEPKALMLSSIFFDLRYVYGSKTLFKELNKNVLDKTQNNQFFISLMAGNALTHQAPLGFFRNFVMSNDEQHRNTLDIKHRGVVPVVDIARILALENGIAAVNTVERLEAAHNVKALSTEMYENLVDAFEFIASLRIRHQARQIRNGLKADNYLPPSELSGLEKSHLKDSFSVIKTMQSFFETRYQVSR